MTEEPDLRGVTDSPSWRVISRIRDLATRAGGGVPADDRCLPQPYRIEASESDLIVQPMTGETQGCKSEGTMALVPYEGEAGKSNVVRVCVDDDAVYLWPRFAPGAAPA